MKKTKTVAKPVKSTKTSSSKLTKTIPNKTLVTKKTPTPIKSKPAAKTSKVTSAKAEPVEKMAVKKVEESLKAKPSIKPVLGQARVIEPLSWDAEKPKLNMMLTNKISRKDKDKEETEVKSYSIKSRYTVGDRVLHTDFGKGLVRDLIGDFKIRVAFRDFEKVLVHGINS